MRLFVAVCLFLVCQSLCFAAESPSRSETARSAYRKLVEGAMTGNVQAMEEAVKAGASVNQLDGKGMSPIGHAIGMEQPGSLMWLLAHGANPKADVMGYVPPLTYALELGNEKAVFQLLEAGADMRQGDSGFIDKSPISSLFENSGTKVLEEFARRGVDFRKDYTGSRDAMTRAILANNPEAVSFLLNRGLGANEKTEDGNYALAHAAVVGNPEIVKILLEQGADPSAVSHGKLLIKEAKAVPHTALVNAVRRNRLPVVQMLLIAGADPGGLNNAAIKWADLLGNHEIYQALLKAGAVKPGPYAFLDLPELNKEGRIPVRPELDYTDFSMLAAMNNADRTAVPEIKNNVSVAIVPASDGLSEASALLTASLSAVPNLVLVERDQLRALGSEQLRSGDGRFDHSTLALGGMLKGADFVLFLSGPPEQMEMRLVQSSSGLVYFQSLAALSKTGPVWAKDSAEAISRGLTKATADPAARFIVSIPNLTSRKSTPEGDLLLQQISTGLGIFLGSQPGILVLDRKEMRSLSLEKDLQADVRSFVRSGLLLDGELEFSPENQIMLTLRARTVDGVEKTTVRASGPKSEIIRLLNQAGYALLSEFGTLKIEPLDAAAEAKAYHAEALKSYASQLWPQAYAQTKAAEALGCKGEEFFKLRLLSICMLMKSDLIALSSEKGKIRKDDEMEILSQAMPLEFQHFSTSRRSPSEYLDLSHDLLNLIMPVIQSEVKPDKHAQAYWEYLPFVIEVANLPLEMLTTLSDEESWQPEIKELREKLLFLSETGIQKTKSLEMPVTCRTLILQRTVLLKYWKTNESEVIGETMEIIREAHNLEVPYALHSLMRDIFGNFRSTARRFDTRAATYNARLARVMADSDLPHARLRGSLCMESYAVGRIEDIQWRQRAFESYLPVVVEDLSRCGVSRATSLTEQPPTLHRNAPDGPNQLLSFSPWYSDERPNTWPNGARMYWELPYHLEKPREKAETLPDPKARVWLEDLTSRRLEFMAQKGGSTFQFMIDPDMVDDRVIDKWSDLAEKAKTSLAVAVQEKKYPHTAESTFSSNVVARLQNVKSLRQAKDTSKTLGNFAGFLPEALPDFRHLKLSEAGNTLQIEAEVCGANKAPDSNGEFYVWLEIREAGFVKVSSTSRPLETIRFPEGVSGGNLLDESNEYLVAELEYDGPDKKQIVIFDRIRKQWRMLEHRLGARVLFLNGKLLVDSLSHPEGKLPSDPSKDERTTGALELIDPATLTSTVLVSSRRTPPESPLDNTTILPVGAGKPERVSETVFFYRGHVYDMVKGEWRPAAKHDRDLVQKNRMGFQHLLLAPWAGQVFAPAFDNKNGMLVFPVHMNTPITTPEGGRLNQVMRLQVPIPLPEFRLDVAGSNAGSMDNQSMKLESFRFSKTDKAVIAYNGQMIVVIPNSVFYPYIKNWLEENQIPKSEKPPAK